MAHPILALTPATVNATLSLPSAPAPLYGGSAGISAGWYDEASAGTWTFTEIVGIAGTTGPTRRIQRISTSSSSATLALYGPSADFNAHLGSGQKYLGVCALIRRTGSGSLTTRGFALGVDAEYNIDYSQECVSSTVTTTTDWTVLTGDLSSTTTTPGDTTKVKLVFTTSAAAQSWIIDVALAAVYTMDDTAAKLQFPAGIGETNSRFRYSNPSRDLPAGSFKDNFMRPAIDAMVESVAFSGAHRAQIDRMYWLSATQADGADGHPYRPGIWHLLVIPGLSSWPLAFIGRMARPPEWSLFGPYQEPPLWRGSLLLHEVL